MQAPLFMVGEAGLECILPLMMAELIDTLTGRSMGPILRIGLVLVLMAMISLVCGVLSGVRAATALGLDVIHPLINIEGWGIVDGTREEIS